MMVGIETSVVMWLFLSALTFVVGLFVYQEGWNACHYTILVKKTRRECREVVELVNQTDVSSKEERCVGNNEKRIWM